MLVQVKQRLIEPDIQVVELAGRLALADTLQNVEGELQQLVQSGAQKVILDLSDLRSIDSAGIGMLMMISGLLADAGGQMRIAGAQGMVAQTFQVVHLERVVPMHADAEAAAEAFSA
jgi:anti-anti-sigma factor